MISDFIITVFFFQNKIDINHYVGNVLTASTGRKSIAKQNVNVCVRARSLYVCARALQTGMRLQILRLKNTT